MNSTDKYIIQEDMRLRCEYQRYMEVFAPVSASLADRLDAMAESDADKREARRMAALEAVKND